VNGNAATTGDKPYNAITRKRLTALGETHQDVVEPRNSHTDSITTHCSGTLEDPLQRRWLRPKLFNNRGILWK
jgi:hypothetical protein